MISGIRARQHFAASGLGVLMSAAAGTAVDVGQEPDFAGRSRMTYEEMAPHFGVAAAKRVEWAAPPTVLDFPETDESIYIDAAKRKAPKRKQGIVLPDGTYIPIPEPRPEPEKVTEAVPPEAGTEVVPLPFVPDDEIPFPMPRPKMEPVRSLKIYNTHTKERIEAVYKRGDVLDSQGIEALTDILKDHRRNEKHEIDPKLFDLLGDIKAEIQSRYPALDVEFEMVSGYRSPITNKKLKNTKGRGGQADGSRHMHGEAMDIRVPGVPRKELRDIAWCLQRGGVGDYPNDDFVHVDVFTQAPKKPSYPGQVMRTWGWQPKADQCNPKAP